MFGTGAGGFGMCANTAMFRQNRQTVLRLIECLICKNKMVDWFRRQTHGKLLAIGAVGSTKVLPSPAFLSVFRQFFRNNDSERAGIGQVEVKLVLKLGLPPLWLLLLSDYVSLYWPTKIRSYFLEKSQEFCQIGLIFRVPTQKALLEVSVSEESRNWGLDFFGSDRTCPLKSQQTISFFYVFFPSCLT